MYDPDVGRVVSVAGLSPGDDPSQLAKGSSAMAFDKVGHIQPQAELTADNLQMTNFPQGFRLIGNFSRSG